MAQKGNGRHRADVELNLLEEFEVRSRRSVREAERARQSRAARRLARKQAKLERANRLRLAHESARQGKTSGRFIVRRRVGKSVRHRNWMRRAAMLVSAGLMGAFALPAYAYNPEVSAMVGFATTNPSLYSNSSEFQQLVVSAVNTFKLARGNYSSTDAAEVQRQEILNGVRTYSGLTAEDYLANPAYKNINASKVLEVASKYVGTPYVFGGITPAGFDCSGLVSHVYKEAANMKLRGTSADLGRWGPHVSNWVHALKGHGALRLWLDMAQGRARITQSAPVQATDGD